MGSMSRRNKAILALWLVSLACVAVASAVKDDAPVFFAAMALSGALNIGVLGGILIWARKP